MARLSCQHFMNDWATLKIFKCVFPGVRAWFNRTEITILFCNVCLNHVLRSKLDSFTKECHYWSGTAGALLVCFGRSVNIGPKFCKNTIVKEVFYFKSKPITKQKRMVMSLKFNKNSIKQACAKWTSIQEGRRFFFGMFSAVKKCDNHS